MKPAELIAFRAKLVELVQAGSEEDVRAFVDENFSQLPEQIQRKLITSLFVSAVSTEARELEVIDDIQDRGLRAMQELAAFQKEIEAEPEDRS